jgi:hypothetical protein
MASSEWPSAIKSSAWETASDAGGARRAAASSSNSIASSDDLGLADCCAPPQAKVNEIKSAFTIPRLITPSFEPFMNSL